MKTTATDYAHYIHCLIENGRETYKTPAFWVQYSYYSNVLTTPTATRENYVETSSAECYWNLARNVENTSNLSTYFFEYSTATMQIFQWHPQLLERITWRHQLSCVIEIEWETLNIWANLFTNMKEVCRLMKTFNQNHNDSTVLNVNTHIHTSFLSL
jgi:hypothetical protein